MNTIQIFALVVFVLLIIYFVYDVLFWLQRKAVLRSIASGFLLVLLVLLLVILALRK